MTGVLIRRRRDTKPILAQRKGHVRTKERRKRSVSQGERPQEKPTLLAP